MHSQTCMAQHELHNRYSTACLAWNTWLGKHSQASTAWFALSAMNGPTCTAWFALPNVNGRPHMDSQHACSDMHGLVWIASHEWPYMHWPTYMQNMHGLIYPTCIAQHESTKINDPTCMTWFALSWHAMPNIYGHAWLYMPNMHGKSSYAPLLRFVGSNSL